MSRFGHKVSALVVLAFAGAFLTAPSAVANISDPVPSITGTFSANKLLIKYSKNSTDAQRESVRDIVSSRGSSSLSELDSNTEILRLDPNKFSISEAIVLLKKSKFVELVEPDYQLRKLDVPLTNPDDLWGMFGDDTANPPTYGSAAKEAWDLGYEGSSDVVVGVIDEGVQVTHPDLAANIWTNPGEISGDGIDNDLNGYIDDIKGWDFFSDDASVFDGSASSEIDSHGTHVSGTIGGSGLNTGVTGVSPNVKIISAKFLGPTNGDTSDAIDAIDYLVDLKIKYLANVATGANVVAINNSWGGDGRSQLLLDAINRAGDAGIVFVVAAGNDGTNNDQAPTYPASYKCIKNYETGTARDWDCVVTVAAINKSGGLAKFSNYGNVSVDIAAPGGDCSNLNLCDDTAFDQILSTLPVDAYGGFIGTSMAAPHLAGAIALCAAANPALTAKDLRNLVVNSASSTESLRSKVVSGGRLDVFTLIHGCVPANTLPPIIANKAFPNFSAGQVINHSFLAMGGNGSYTWNLSGQLPSGVAFNPATGALSGTATEVGNFPISVTATSGTTNTRSFVLKVNKIGQSNLSITNQRLSSYVGEAITLTATGGNGSGAITFATSSPGCAITNDQLVAQSVVDCLVRATKSESGVYSSATSSPVAFSFALAPVPAAVSPASVQPSLKIQSSLTSKSVASIAGVSYLAKSSVTLSVSKKYAKVCKVSKSKLVTTKKSGLCKVTIKVKPKKGKKISKTITFSVIK